MQIQLSEHFSYMNTPWFQGVWISGLATVHAIVHMLLEHTSYNLTVYVLLLPTNFKTYLKQPLEDQQTVLYFCRDDHLYPVAERSDFFAGYNATQLHEHSGLESLKCVPYLFSSCCEQPGNEAKVVRGAAKLQYLCEQPPPEKIRPVSIYYTDSSTV